MDVNDDGKFDVKDYLELQKQMDEEARRAMSTFMAEKLRVDKTLKADANITTATLDKKK
jgi:predicted HicB family RNase H-like nuclease